MITALHMGWRHVPFTNVDVRPTWVPDGWGVRLPELNLRTYVTHDGHDGVYFFSLDAQGIFGVGGARLFHHLPYYYARCSLTEADGDVKFESRRLHPGARDEEHKGSQRVISIDPCVFSGRPFGVGVCPCLGSHGPVQSHPTNP